MNEFHPESHVLYTKIGRITENKLYGNEPDLIKIRDQANRYSGPVAYHIRICEEDDIAQQKLDWYAEKYVNLIVSELKQDKQIFHGSSNNLPDFTIFLQQIKEGVEEEMLYGESPRDMGWVGDDGLP